MMGTNEPPKGNPRPLGRGEGQIYSGLYLVYLTSSPKRWDAEKSLLELSL